jgi:cell division protein YceG involved in septum cleavage
LKYSSSRSISLELKNKNIIRSRTAFEAFVIILGREKHVIAGDYYFEENLPVYLVAMRIARGEHHIAPIAITIPEGFDNNEHRWMTIKIRVLCEFSFPEISRERVMSIVYTRDTILKIIDDRRYLIERWTAGTNDYLMHGTNPWDS